MTAPFMASGGMMNRSLNIITAEERLAEQRGAKILIVGPTGVGKTSLLRTLDPDTTLFLDIEAGDLAVRDVPVDTIRIDDWVGARDLACLIGGPNPSFAPSCCYSEAHYRAIAMPSLADRLLAHVSRCSTIFVNSLTAASRLSFRWAEQQPETFSERTGSKDVRGAYGLHAREMINWLNELRMRAAAMSSLSESSSVWPTTSAAPSSPCRLTAARSPASCPASSTK